MKIQEIHKLIDHKIAPFALADEWDNVGLLVGDGEAQVQGILLALDATCAVIDEAVARGCNLVVTHHPVIFDAIKSVTGESVVYYAIRKDVAIISAHTNYDKVQSGINDILAAALGLKNPMLMDSQEGYSRVGELQGIISPQEFAKRIGQAVGISPRYNPGGREIARVGVCGGSGGETLFTTAAQEHGLDAFVTADVKHHEFLAAAAQGVTLYDAGHFATENLAMPSLRDTLARLLPGLPMLLAQSYSGQLLG